MTQNELAQPNASVADSPLLIIDDNVENLKLFQRMLEWAGYTNILGCTTAQKGLEAIQTFGPDLIVLDLMMPVMDGYEFLRTVSEDSSLRTFTPILVFTGDVSTEARIRALNLGASDFLTKPGDAIEIQLKVRNFLRMRKMHVELENQNQILEARVQERTERLVTARLEAIEVLASSCEYRDDETGRHAHRVGKMSAAIAKEMGLDPEFVQSIRLAAPLHDLGKIAVPDSILFKPEKLSDEEYSLMKHHCRIGADLLGGKSSPLMQLAQEIALHHHEWWDGSGYPAGLAGKSIPTSARIVAVADAFDAMTNDRPYRKSRPTLEALNELEAMSGIQFDPAVVKAFHRELVGTITLQRKAA